MALSATPDKPAYLPGDTMTLTVTSDKRLTSSTFPVAAGGESVQVTTTVQTPVAVNDPVRKWTVKSDDGRVQVLTSTA